MDARVKTSRSSLARVEALEDGKQLLGALDVRVRFLGSEALNRMDLSPGDGDRVHARRLRGAHVEGRVADVGRVRGTSIEQLERFEDGVGSRLVALRVVGADHDVEVRPDAEPV